MTKKLPAFILCLTALLLQRPAAAGTISSCSTPSGAISCTGTVDTPEDVFLESFTLAGNAAITVQTYGFGGGTNAAGTSIVSGGFDSLVALFSGTPATASIVTDGGGNPIASADNLSLFSPGCPPAGLVTVGSVPGVCGDNTLTVTLGAGTYTLLLSDANYLPFAVNPGPPISSLLSDGYGDISGGAFQTCASQVDCNTDSGKFAVDITGLGPTSAPEPGTLTLFAAGLALLFGAHVARALVPAASPLMATLVGLSTACPSATAGVETSLDTAGTSARATSGGKRRTAPQKKGETYEIR